jgi:hypothetical protein
MLHRCCGRFVSENFCPPTMEVCVNQRRRQLQSKVTSVNVDTDTDNALGAVARMIVTNVQVLL